MDKLITEGVKVDAIITDPPYGTTACKWDSIIPLEPMWAQLKRVIKPNGAIVLFGSQPFTSVLVMSNLKWFKYCWVWDKKIPSGMSYARYQPMRQHEDVVVFCDGKTTYNAQKTLRDKPIKGGGMSKGETTNNQNLKALKKTYTHKNPTTLISFDKIRCGSVHPTQKPVALMEYLIKTYTNEGETVLDFTMGSGTTGVACVNTGRDFIGIELDENYYNIANDRIEKTIVNKEEHYLQHTQQLDLFDPESIQESIYQGEML
jgi:site-specific DNA-methyltransferase (adenine-specific)